MKKLQWLVAIVMIVAVALPVSLPSAPEMAEAQDGDTEITFWHFWGSPVRRTAIRRVVAICEAQMDGVKVKNPAASCGALVP